MYFLKNVVIGNSLKSIEKAGQEETTLIRNHLGSPVIYDKDKREWHNKIFQLGLAGKDFYHGEINSIRINEEFIKVNSRLGSFKYEYEKCFVYEFENLVLQDNDLIDHNTDVHKITDWFEIKRGADFSDVDIIEIEDSFIKRIIFYESGRVDHAGRFKDLAVESNLTTDILNEFQYATTMVKFFCEQHLSDVYKTTIKLELTERDAGLLYKPNYKDSKKVTFVYD